MTNSGLDRSPASRGERDEHRDAGVLAGRDDARGRRANKRGAPTTSSPPRPETIAYLTFHEAGPTFGADAPRDRRRTSPRSPPPAAASAYPSFTPDRQAVAFHAGTTPTGCSADACDDTTTDDGKLFVAQVAGGTPIRLVAADDPPDATDTNASVEPTFNPIQRGGYSWVVFTSMRDWGNRPGRAT